MKRCKICQKETGVTFNIGFKKTPICEICADTITSQQIQDLLRQNLRRRLSHLNPK